ncbi:RNA polymerase sigma-70 factor [Reichenbachiella ulvae]|uniref:RNA polymerase sigma-70 factor n=1 Tax=Reichenbachiella ulvae TaxID=2980104 RepID=A0ABT3CRK2_9BACT|nr:RNA polymerase sigma-70 factor [Reichenbachiella ulvae]MCV9386335.1 RNA polymerase sigma-70 factor [Reichenbachiella ulvae]
MAKNSVHIFDFSDEKQFELLFKEFYQPLTAFAFQYLKDSIEAEETIQEIFSTLWQKSEEIEIRTTVKSYLYGAVRNNCLNQLKHKKVIQAHEETVRFQGEESNGEDFLELEELQQRIDSALDSLPEKCRQIFEMSRFEDKKYKDIAEELDLSIKTVETQMSRALKVMRAALGQYLTVLVLWVSWLIEKALSG